ncbi:L,D-transpeptidase family protein [Methylocapsa palsarum]|uniref:Murein L,D-transpeptidase YafK n=1 Tax=Methylocapsa palsarum TaxID=1612308 RepID=A0A1I3ZNB2_9HYPH|nr:murein L,D-transpeptidase family protein [Methylocapsa palsarum]SFK45430.1 Murein L,D-transpeptidase YafK [Methylocapsa palsarum]
MIRKPFVHRAAALALLSGLAVPLAGCEDSGLTPNAHAYAPIAPETLALMEEKGTTKSAPVLIRTYKKESELEIWKMKADGRYALLKTYPMCRWSGQLGPKVREGDRQVPEGFYSITPAQMNPNSAYYLSMNVGYPNAYDRAMGRAGGSIMVHGVCSSAGCFSMTDPQIGEIYAIAREGFAGGQRAVQMQSYPFRMTAENLAKYRLDPNISFWKQLKEGSDNFEVTRQDVRIGVCDKHYVFNAVPANGSQFDATAACPPLKRDDEVQRLVAQKEQKDSTKIAELAAQGVRPVRTVYADGGQHPSFASKLQSVSRPEALAQGPVDIALDDGTAASKKIRLSPAVQLAGLRASAPASATIVAPSNPADVTGTISEPVKQSASLLGRWFGPKASADDAAPAAAATASASVATAVTPPPAAPQTAKSKQAAVTAKPASPTVKAKTQAATPAAKPAKEITGATAAPPPPAKASGLTTPAATVAVADQLPR